MVKRKHYSKNKIYGCTSINIENAENSSFVICNESKSTLTLCWVDEKGVLYHYYRLPKGGTHEEQSVLGHSFVCCRLISDRERFKNFKDLPLKYIVSCYRLDKIPGIHTIRIAPSLKVFNSIEPYASPVTNSTAKMYMSRLFYDFTVLFEPNLFEEFPGLEIALEEDFSQLTLLWMNQCPNALERLRNFTSIYLNKSLVYGHNVTGHACCYHPRAAQQWLMNMGMSTGKAGHIEVYSAQEYLRDRVLWGPGGLLCHELCHAYHDKICTNGYLNADIEQAYTKAMAGKLYDHVEMHTFRDVSTRVGGVTKVMRKHYACTNCMEFFAELSVAYLFNNETIDHSDELLVDEEFNKWFPFNRRHLRMHDPATYALLVTLYKDV